MFSSACSQFCSRPTDVARAVFLTRGAMGGSSANAIRWTGLLRRVPWKVGLRLAAELRHFRARFERSQGLAASFASRPGDAGGVSASLPRPVASSWRGARKAIRRSVAADALGRSASLWSRPRHFRVRFERFQRLAAPFSIPGGSGSQAAGFEATRRRAGSLTRSPARAAAPRLPNWSRAVMPEPILSLFKGLERLFRARHSAARVATGRAVAGATIFASPRPFAPLPGRRHREPPQRRREPPTFPGAFDLKTQS